MKKCLSRFGQVLIFVAFFSAQGFAQESWNINLLHNWKEDSLPASVAFNNTYNEVWGVARSGREYAIIGSTMGTHFFDVTDPINTVPVDYVAGATQGVLIVHRDYHDYGDYLYMVTDEGPGTLQIVDLSFLPDSVEVVYDSDALFNTSHNIFIDTATAKLYACEVFSPSRGSVGIEVYHLSQDPLSPQLMNPYDAIGDVHDIYVINDTAYCNNGSAGLRIVDFSDAVNPVLIGSLTAYPDQGYNHSGWLSEDKKTYVLADETHGMRMKILDVSDLGNINVESLFGSEIDPNSVPHNVLIKGDYAYVSYYHDGLYIFNIKNPATPQLKGYYDTYLPLDHSSYRGAWGVFPHLPSGIVLVSDMQTGLYVFDATAAVGLDKYQMNKGVAAITILTNPVHDFISFLTDIQTKLSVTLYNITGELVFEIHQVEVSPMKETSLNVSHLPCGLYVMNIQGKGVEFSESIMKQDN